MTQDVLIPRAEDIKEIDISDVKWVLILEKEVDHLTSYTISALNTHTRRPSTADSQGAAITQELQQEKGFSSQ